MKYIFQILVEILLLFFYPLIGWTDVFFRKSLTPSGKKPTIVLVERWFSSHPLHRYWVRYLEQKGFSVYLHNFPLQSGSFRGSAKELASFLNERDLKDVTLVGLSNGGITAYLYLQELEGWNRVERFISIASPFKGTFWMYLLPFFQSIRELVPGSNLIKEIKSQKVRNPERISILSARFDELVPVSSSNLKHVGVKKIDVIGHNYLHLVSKETYFTIASLASNSEF